MKEPYLEFYKRINGFKAYVVDGDLIRTEKDIGFTNFGQHYCNPPEAPIWMGDFSFKPIGEIHIGDSIIGWKRPENNADYHVSNGSFATSILCRTIVINIMKRFSEIVKVRMESGRILRCTPDHRWACGKAGHQMRFLTPKVGRTVSHVITPTPDFNPAFLLSARWLGGLYDGEGTGDRIAQSMESNPEICEEINRVLSGMGFSFTQRYNCFRILGGRQALVNFINYTKPIKSRHWLERKILNRRFRKADKIISVEPDGEGEVISLTTTTGNYIAWGYASKNCHSYIPKNELWLDDTAPQGRDEYKYFVQHMLVEYSLMSKGFSYHKASDMADKVEREVRKRDLEDRPIHKKKLGKIGKLNIWLVEGEQVRDKLDVEFTEGGHDLAYRYIPKDEIWVDDSLRQKERPEIVLHEVYERNKMSQGVQYDEAHKESSEVEKKVRKKKGWRKWLPISLPGLKKSKK